MDEELARLTIFVEADRDVAFVTRNFELVSKRHAGVRHPMPNRLIDTILQHRQLFFQA